MGSSPSKERNSRSPSAAFGRIRIDSPQARQIHRKIRSERSLANLAGQTHSTGNLKGLGSQRLLLPPASVSASERSPLISRELPGVVSKPTDAVVIPPAWWIVPALICASFYALYNIFIKLGSASIHPILGGVILQFVAAILGSILLVGIMIVDGVEELNYDMTGIKWAVFAGLAVGAAEILSFIVSGLGVPASKSIPVIIGGSVGIGCVMGWLFLKEMLGTRGWMGVAFIVAGVGLVGTDPNVSLH